MWSKSCFEQKPREEMALISAEERSVLDSHSEEVTFLHVSYLFPAMVLQRMIMWEDEATETRVIFSAVRRNAIFSFVVIYLLRM